MNKHKSLLSVLLFILFLSSCSSPLREAVIDQLELPSPVITPIGGDYSLSQEIEISQNDPDAEIHYTIQLDGNVIDEGIYSGPIPIGEHTKRFIVSAFCRKKNALDSPETTETYNFFYNRISAPVITPAGGTKNSDTIINIENAQGSEGCTIMYYISNHPAFDSENISFKQYTGPVTLPGDDKEYTVNAYAITTGKPQSDSSIEQYEISYPLLEPLQMDPSPGNLSSTTSVTLTQLQNARIFYKATVNGIEGFWQTYSNPIPLTQMNSTTVFNLKIEKAGYKAIETAATYTINPSQNPSPRIESVSISNPNGLSQSDQDSVISMNMATGTGTVGRNFKLDLSTLEPLTSGGGIFYTLTENGSEPPLPIAENENGTMVAVAASGTQRYDGIPIAFSTEGRKRLRILTASPTLANSPHFDVDVSLDYLSAPTPTITYTGPEISNEASQSWSLSFDTSQEYRNLNAIYEYSLDGGINWINVADPESFTSQDMTAEPGEDNSFDLQARVRSTDPELDDSELATHAVIKLDREPPGTPTNLAFSSSRTYNSTNYYSTANLDSMAITCSSGGGGSGNFTLQIAGLARSEAVHSSTIPLIDYISDPISTLSDGNHTLYIQERDEAGNLSPAASIGFDCDFTGPTLDTIDIYTRNGGAYIPYVFSDTQGLDSVTCLTGGVTADSQPSYTYLSGMTNFSAASVTLQAADTIGNTTTITTDPFIPGVVLVKSGNTGILTGSDWNTAYSTLQIGINNARANDIPEVWVAQGVYQTTGSQVAELTNCSGLILRGSFKGSTLAKTDKGNVLLNPSIIDGNNSARGIFSNSGSAEIRDFLITRGRGSTTGGGAYLNDTAMDFINCIFFNNQATSDGGAVYITGTLNDRFINCAFIENKALYGAGVYQRAATQTEMYNCTFQDNYPMGSVNSHGGSIYLVQGNMDVYNGFFFELQNSSYYDLPQNSLELNSYVGPGWGAYVADGGELTLRQCGFMHPHSGSYTVAGTTDYNPTYLNELNENLAAAGVNILLIASNPVISQRTTFPRSNYSDEFLINGFNGWDPNASIQFTGTSQSMDATYRFYNKNIEYPTGTYCNIVYPGSDGTTLSLWVNAGETTSYPSQIQTLTKHLSEGYVCDLTGEARLNGMIDLGAIEYDG